MRVALRRSVTAAGAERPVEWPAWVAVVAAGVPVATAFVAALQRDAVLPPRWPLVAAAAAALPWILYMLRVDVPTPLFMGLVLAGVASLLLLDPIPVEEHGVTPFLLVILAGEMAALGTVRNGLVAALAGVAVLVGAEVADPGPHAIGAELWSVGVGLAWATGLMIRSHLKLLGDLLEAQEHLADRAAADERRRIARELHDAIAHSLGVTMLHITGARMALEEDPESAAEALREAERLGRRSLTDIRRTVGLLSPAGPAADGPPLPGASDISALVSDFAGAGLEVRLDVRGDLTRLPGATGPALYRIVQESLANVVRHGDGGAAEVAVAVGDDVTVEVRNDRPEAATVSAPNPDGGLGILGMRERVTLLGGRFRAGPHGSTWLVQATLPLTDETG